MKLKEEILQIINREIVLQSTDCPWRYAPEFAAEKIVALFEQKLNIHGVMQGWPDCHTAQRLLAIRDELVKGNTHEAYHQLCLIADPELENLNHWQKLETIAQGQPTVASEGLDKNA